MTLWLAAPDGPLATRQLREARTFFEAAEARLSRFRPTSELSRLNARAGQRVEVSPLLWDVIVLARQTASQTGGLYDPSVLEALEAAGYDRPFQQIVDDAGASRAPAPTVGQWRAIQLDPATRSVQVPPGLRLDLAGVAKTWVAERAADLLARSGDCLVDAGGDLATRGAAPGQAGWPIGVADPCQPDRDLARLLLSQRGVATSGLDHRRWRRNGRLVHHLIDPRVGEPARTDLLSATVVAADAIPANRHALVTMLLGSRVGLRYLRTQPEVDALLVRADGEILTTSGFGKHVYAWDASD
jgi:thiamine biosynthesis lipoprotein